MFVFKNKKNQEICQWDYNIVLQFLVGSPGQEVHFSNDKKNAIVKKLDENLEVMIPNILLQSGEDIIVYFYVKQNNGYTWKRRRINVIRRPKPENYIYTEPEKMEWEKLEDRITQIEKNKIDKLEAEQLIKDQIQNLQQEGAISGDKNFIFIQKVPSNLWKISHNLNKFPSVTIIDSGESVVVGEIRYIDKNEIQVKFNGSFSGKAFLN